MVRGSTFDVRRQSGERAKFEELEVWQLAHEFCLKVYRITEKFPNHEKYRLVDQLCRASASVPANLAEGEGRYQIADQIRFCHIARGSLSEARYFLILGRDLGLLSCEEENALNELASKLHAKLHSFMNSKRKLADSKSSNLERRTSIASVP